MPERPFRVAVQCESVHFRPVLSYGDGRSPALTPADVTVRKRKCEEAERLQSARTDTRKRLAACLDALHSVSVLVTSSTADASAGVHATVGALTKETVLEVSKTISHGLIAAPDAVQSVMGAARTPWPPHSSGVALGAVTAVPAPEVVYATPSTQAATSPPEKGSPESAGEGLEPKSYHRMSAAPESLEWMPGDAIEDKELQEWLTGR